MMRHDRRGRHRQPTPPYEQIRVQIARMINTGVLPVDARLPPIRQLAADLGVAANTVARAYRELETEGLVVSRVRHGTTAARAYAAFARQLGVPAGQAESAVRAQLRAASSR
jgi:DNA-binding transcriptional regulator YhcF (GntR family)